MRELNIKKTTYKVSDFVSWARMESLQLSPSFQRRPVWGKDAKSYLIDTIIKGLPVPIIFMREKRSRLDSLEPQREIIDGQQRLRTVISFVDSNLIKDIKENDIFFVKKGHNGLIADRPFKDLKNEYKQALLDYEFSVHTLPADVSDAEVLQIFARMNSTGVSLNEQELRNAKYFGEFKSSMYDLAAEQLQRWRDWGIFSETKIARMEEVEFTSDLVMYMIQGITTKNKKNLNGIYELYDSEYKKRKEMEKQFRSTMDQIEDIFENDIKNTIYSKIAFFYPMYAIIYSNVCMHGKKDQSLIKNRIIKRLRDLGYRGELLKAPENIISGYKRRAYSAEDKNILFNYLLGK